MLNITIRKYWQVHIILIIASDCVLPRPAAAGPLAQPADLAGPGVPLLPGAAPTPRPRQQQAGHAARTLLEVHPPARQPRHLLQPHPGPHQGELLRPPPAAEPRGARPARPQEVRRGLADPADLPLHPPHPELAGDREVQVPPGLRHLRPRLPQVSQGQDPGALAHSHGPAARGLRAQAEGDRDHGPAAGGHPGGLRGGGEQLRAAAGNQEHGHQLAAGRLQQDVPEHCPLQPRHPRQQILLHRPRHPVRQQEPLGAHRHQGAARYSS